MVLGAHNFFPGIWPVAMLDLTTLPYCVVIKDFGKKKKKKSTSFPRSRSLQVVNNLNRYRASRPPIFENVAELVSRRSRTPSLL